MIIKLIYDCVVCWAFHSATHFVIIIYFEIGRRAVTSANKCIKNLSELLLSSLKLLYKIFTLLLPDRIFMRTTMSWTFTNYYYINMICFTSKNGRHFFLVLKLVTPAAKCAFSDFCVLQYPIADVRYYPCGNELLLKLVRMKLAYLFFIILLSFISLFHQSCCIHMLLVSVRARNLPLCHSPQTTISVRRIEVQWFRVNLEFLPKGNKDKVNKERKSRRSYVLYHCCVDGKRELVEYGSSVTWVLK